MKRREEEKLIDLAFGELADEEAMQLKSSLHNNVRAAARLSDYRRLQADISLLNSIPEPQISKERIREAILRGGLKERRVHLSWALAAVPSLIAFVSLGLFLSKNSSSHVSNVASVGNAAKSVAEVLYPKSEDLASTVIPFQGPVLHPDTELTNPDQAVRTDVTFGTPMLASAPLKARRLKFSTHRSSAGENGLSDIDVKSLSAMMETDQTSNPTGILGKSAAKVSGSPAIGSGSTLGSAGQYSKIIVVHDSQDGATGAQQATEDDTTANVLVSG